MTWSISGKVSPENFRAEFEAKRDQILEGGNFVALEETKVQMNFAIGQAEAVIQSGTIGHPDMVWVNLLGHANPGNIAKEGTSGDTINVNVSNADRIP